MDKRGLSSMKGGSENDETKIFSVFNKNLSLTKIRLPKKKQEFLSFKPPLLLFSYIRRSSYQQTTARYNRKHYTNGSKTILH